MLTSPIAIPAIPAIPADRPPTGEPTVLATWTATVVRTLDARGLDGSAMARQAGIDPDTLADPGSRLPLSVTTRLWELAEDATGDPCFGLDVARRVRPGTFAELSFGFVSSASFRDGLERLARFDGIVLSPAGEVRVFERGDRVVWGDRFLRGALRPCPMSMEAILASIVSTGRFLVGGRLSPLCVSLERAVRPAGGRFEQFFGCDIEYGSSVYRMEFDRAEVSAPLPTAAPGLALAADRLARDHLARARPTASFTLAARATVRRSVARGETPTAGTVARHLAVSVRTLQRRLHDEQTSLRAIIEDVRVTAARELLSIDGMTVERVSRHLGFHDAASFRRSFKRATGTRPSDVA